MIFSLSPAAVSNATKAACKGCLVSVYIIQRLVKDLSCFMRIKGSHRTGEAGGERMTWKKVSDKTNGAMPGNYDPEECRRISKEHISPDCKMILRVITLFT